MFKPPADNNVYNETNLFWHDMAGTYDSTKELGFTLQIGSKKFPEYPIQSAAEAYYQLRKSLGIHGSAFHSINIKGNEFMTNKFVLGIDTEKKIASQFQRLHLKIWGFDYISVRKQRFGEW